MAKTITIDPITRLEGHGKISIFLDDNGDVEHAAFQIPEFRGFEQFCVDRPAEEMPRITTMICGVCPTAHHMAATKTLDSLYKVDPPLSAKLIRRLMYNAFFVEDHALHFFFLGGPDFVVGPQAPAAERNILGVIGKVGMENAVKVIQTRKEFRQIMTMIGGKVVHPTCGLPGGVSKALTEDDRTFIKGVALRGVDFAKFSLDIFRDIVLKNKDYVDVVVDQDLYYHQTHYMGLVNDQNQADDGKIRVVNQQANEIAKFSVDQYTDHIAEHVEPWSYIKFPFLKQIGWKGFVDGPDSGIYRVAPLGRVNACESMSTEGAEAERKAMYEILGGRPAHHTLAYHWTRLIELLNAAETVQQLAEHPELTNPVVRTVPTEKPVEGIGVVEAPRGTLIHHYKTDEKGVLTDVNLIVATVNNAAAICMSIEKAAKKLIQKGNVSDGLLNMVEMAFRAYDPCFACATHSLPGETRLQVEVQAKDGQVIWHDQQG